MLDMDKSKPFDLEEAVKTLINSEDTESELEEFAAVVIQEGFADDEAYAKKGRALLRAFLDKDVDGFCIALTGWSVESLLKKSGAIEDYDHTFS